MLAIRPFEPTDLDGVDLLPAARTLIAFYASRGPALTATTPDGALVACAGIVALEDRPWVGHAWLVPTPLVKTYRRAVYVAAKDILVSLADTLRIERLETTADADSDVERIWLTHLGFVQEGLHAKAGLAKQTKATYARFFYARNGNGHGP